MKTLDRANAAAARTDTRTETGPGTTAAPTELPSGSTPRVSCPDCAQPAWVEWRDEVNSTSGPVVHVKVRCLDRHWFLMPEAWLTTTGA
jgi:hypothetical protein